MVESFRVDRLAAGGPPANRRETIAEPACCAYVTDCRGESFQQESLVRVGSGQRLKIEVRPSVVPEVDIEPLHAGELVEHRRRAETRFARVRRREVACTSDSLPAGSKAGLHPCPWPITAQPSAASCLMQGFSMWTYSDIRRQPVLYRKGRYSGKLAQVVGDERQAQGARGRRSANRSGQWTCPRAPAGCECRRSVRLRAAPMRASHTEQALVSGDLQPNGRPLRDAEADLARDPRC
jgi:hypothetical protein